MFYTQWSSAESVSGSYGGWEGVVVVIEVEVDGGHLKIMHGINNYRYYMYV